MFNSASKPDNSRPRPPAIRIAFRTFWRTIKHGYDNIGTLLVISLIWFAGVLVCSPITLLLVFFVQSVVGTAHYELLLLPLGALTAGLHRVTRPMSEERVARWQDMFKHLRADWRWSTLLMGMLLLGFIVLQINIRYYTAGQTSIALALTILSLTMLMLWSGVALFAFPLALRQDDQRLRTTLRNAVLMTMANAPGVLFSLILLLVLLAILLIPPLFLIMPGVVALWGQENVRLLLVAAGIIPKDPIADRESGA